MPNIRSQRPAETRDFFVELLGFKTAMDIGWVVTVASPTDPSVQVNIISNDDPAAPGISVGVDDVDAVHAVRKPRRLYPECDAARSLPGADAADRLAA